MKQNNTLERSYIKDEDVIEAEVKTAKAKDLNTDFLKRLSKFKIDLNEDIPPPEIVWSIKVKGQEYTAGTKGNFSVIIGKAKAKKTFSITLLLADYLKNENIKRVLYFDTEQSKYHVQKAVKRILIKNGITPSNLDVFHFRSLTITERIELIEQAIYHYDDVDLVIIDGARELITSINDEEQATMVTSKFLKWTEERNLHLITVLHQNKGDNNARGTIGTEIMNKAELVLSVTKLEDIKDSSSVETVVSRNKEIPPFAFTIDEQGIPHQQEEWNKPSNVGNGVKRISPEDIPNVTYNEILDLCYSKNEQLKYSDLVHQLDLAISKISGVKLSTDKLKKTILHLQNEKLIEQQGKAGTIKSFYVRISD